MAGNSTAGHSMSSSLSSATSSPCQQGKTSHNSIENEAQQQIDIEHALNVLSLNQESTTDDEDEVERTAKVPFDPAQCLFCSLRSADMDNNLEHMLQKHGLFIPDESRLIVDLETLIEYFHLVIYGYFECLFCGSQRHSAEAARQHMIGKGHCKIDISAEDSEFRDFYETESYSDASEHDDDDEEAEPRSRLSKANIIEVDNVMRLPSGKILSHRTQGDQSFRRKKSTPGSGLAVVEKSTTPVDTWQPASESSPSASTQPESSKRVAKREAIFQNQLASLRADDRRSLMHLPLPQQRALVMKSKKQVEKARKDQNDMLLKIQLKSNKTAKN